MQGDENINHERYFVETTKGSCGRDCLLFLVILGRPSCSERRVPAKSSLAKDALRQPRRSVAAFALAAAEGTLSFYL